MPYKYQTPSGVHDLLPQDQTYFEAIITACKTVADFYNFGKIDTPIFEKAEVFTKSLGQTTDIVEKQMYFFETKGGEELVLRPEATAPIARAFVQHGMKSWPQPVKLWTFGPFYRYERPQAGRYRQFHQFDFEILGEKSPAIDVQVIVIFMAILNELNLKDIALEINSIGDRNCRPYYKKILKSYFREYEKDLCVDCKRRLKENPLRVLDCKEEKCQRISKQAPHLLDHLCQECKNHFKQVLEFLDELRIPYILNPHLVRGLDYYTKTVFEIFPKSDQEEQNSLKTALIGGGRYDTLVQMLGGPETPACGGAGGIERIIEVLKTKGKVSQKEKTPEIFLVQLGELAKRKALWLLEEFRKSNIRVLESIGKDSLRAQLKLADKAKAKFALILGQKEAVQNKIIIRDMAKGTQIQVNMDNIISEVKKLLKNK